MKQSGFWSWDDLDRDLCGASEALCRVISHARRWQTITIAIEALQHVQLQYKLMNEERQRLMSDQCCGAQQSRESEQQGTAG